jgi:hypothetical protein
MMIRLISCAGDADSELRTNVRRGIFAASLVVLFSLFFRDGKKRSHTGHSICRVRGTADDGADDFCLISS